MGSSRRIAGYKTEERPSGEDERREKHREQQKTTTTPATVAAGSDSERESRHQRGSQLAQQYRHRFRDMWCNAPFVERAVYLFGCCFIFIVFFCLRLRSNASETFSSLEVFFVFVSVPSQHLWRESCMRWSPCSTRRNVFFFSCGYYLSVTNRFLISGYCCDVWRCTPNFSFFKRWTERYPQGHGNISSDQRSIMVS